MNPAIKKVLCATCISFSLVFSASAALNKQDIDNYNQAAEGDKALVDPTLERLTTLIKAEGPTALTLVYLGSTQTLKGRDAWMPWTAMKHVEKGLANIDKGLTLLASESKSLSEQSMLNGLKESYLTQALAATTYSQLPDMFNHFERGYELYLTLLADPNFESQPFVSSAWVYGYAIKAALRANDHSQATTWLSVMQRLDDKNTQTVTAAKRLAEYK